MIYGMVKKHLVNDSNVASSWTHVSDLLNLVNLEDLHGLFLALSRSVSRLTNHNLQMMHGYSFRRSWVKTQNESRTWA